MSDTNTAGHSTYPSYKTSGMEWLGDVPEHWETTTMRRYCRVFSGATPDRAIPNYWDGGTIPWIASGDVNLRRIVKAQQFITEAGYNASSTRYIRPGSLVLALAGQGRTKGTVATVECRTTCNQSLAAIEPSPQVSDYNFLAYYLESRYTDIRALVGNGLRDGLNLKHIRGIQTPLPPLDEQAAIVRYLDDADRRIREYVNMKERLIALLEEERQAIIHQAVTRGLDPNVRLKDSGVEWLGEVPEHWGVRRLRYLGEAIIGLTYEPQEVTDSGTLVLRASNIRGGEITLDDRVTVQKDIPSRLVTQEGDILICSRSGSRSLIGKNARIGLESAGVTFGAFMTIFRGPNNDYLHQVFNSKLFEYQSGAFLTSTINQLTLSMIHNIHVPFPPEREQQEITQFIVQATKAIKDAINRHQSQTDLMNEYRARLIADVVTGQLDVREATERLPPGHQETNLANDIVITQEVSEL